MGPWRAFVYERSSHARIKTAILISPLALFSKGKKHWLTISYHNDDESQSFRFAQA